MALIEQKGPLPVHIIASTNRPCFQCKAPLGAAQRDNRQEKQPRLCLGASREARNKHGCQRGSMKEGLSWLSSHRGRTRPCSKMQLLAPAPSPTSSSPYLGTGKQWDAEGAGLSCSTSGRGRSHISCRGPQPMQAVVRQRHRAGLIFL